MSKSDKIVMEGITFDDVLLIPQKSSILPNEVSLRVDITQKITLNIPIMSAAMDTVTESELAIALAKEGGLGFIHKNMSIEKQAEEVKKVKSIELEQEITPSSNSAISKIKEFIKGKNSNISLKDANACIDDNGKLRVGAAVGVGQDTIKRVEALVAAGVDIITVDSAHGHSKGVIDKIKEIKNNFPKLEIIGGNIVTKEAAVDLIKAGVSAVKVGVGPGSICTTRVVAGVGVPQISAIMEITEICAKKRVGLIADGGIKISGDIVKALAAGADCVMLGGLLAGTDEAPGEVIEKDGKKYKTYVGMGSLAAMERGSTDRYFQTDTSKEKLVPEGIESMIACKGELSSVIYQLCGGIRSGMGYCGTETIEELKENGKFVKITSAGLVESHPHDVIIIKEAPNYSK